MKKLYITFFVVFMVSISSMIQAQVYYTSTYAGSTAGDATNDNINNVKFRSPERLTYDKDSNIIVVDRGNHVIRKISPLGVVSTIAGSGITGYNDANGVNAQFASPWGIAVDASGNIYVADRDNRRIRKIATNGDVSTYAGSGANDAVDHDSPLLASFKQPLDLVFDKNGNLLVADGTAHKIRKIATDGKVSTLAGTGITGFKDDSNPLNAQFASPSGLGIDHNGNILVADRINHKVRKIDLANNVSTVAGSGTKGTVNNSQPLLAQLSEPYDVDVDANGNIYVVELAHDVRKIATDGKVSTIAGIGGSPGFVEGDNTLAKFNNPSGLCIARNGTIYIADLSNNRIRKISTENPLPVNLISFKAKSDNANSIVITWSTASEQNNAYFELLKSNDGTSWILAATINAKGNSNQTIAYSYTDVTPFYGANYYVLKQVDFDGKSSSTAAVNVNLNLSLTNKLRAHYTNNALKIYIQGLATGDGQVIVHNLNGQILTSQNITLTKGINEFSIPLNLQSGLYVLSLVSQEDKQVTKFIVRN